VVKVGAFALILAVLALDLAVNAAQSLKARGASVGHFAPANDLVFRSLSFSFDPRLRYALARLFTALIVRVVTGGLHPLWRFRFRAFLSGRQFVSRIAEELTLLRGRRHPGLFHRNAQLIIELPELVIISLLLIRPSRTFSSNSFCMAASRASGESGS
jgi:hypothetical protein